MTRTISDICASIVRKNIEEIDQEVILSADTLFANLEEQTKQIIYWRCGIEIDAKTVEEVSMTLGLSIPEIREIEVPAMRSIEATLKALDYEKDAPKRTPEYIQMQEALYEAKMAPIRVYEAKKLWIADECRRLMAEEEKIEAEKAEGRSIKEQILVLDDFSQNVDMFVNHYRHTMSVHGEVVISVHEALQAVEKYQPEVIMLDIELTNLCANEGAEVALKLKEQGYKGLIISHSSMPVEVQKEIMLASGVVHYIEKHTSFLPCIKGECKCHKIK